MDVLADLLTRSRAHGAAFAYTTVDGDWGIDFPQETGLVVHTVLSGETYLRPAGGDPVRVIAGDVVVIDGGRRHGLASGPQGPLQPLDEFIAATGVPGSSRRFEALQGDGPPVSFLCGAYSFGGNLCDPLLAALPTVVLVRAEAATPLRAALDLLADEMSRDRSGQQTVLDRLLDVVLVQVLRSHFADLQAEAPPWFRAQDDREVGRALALLHSDPAHPWTIAALAAAVAVSRATLARRFAALVGVPPLQYLTEWRMALAREQLRDSTDTIAQVAADVGYAEYAFAAAFKRSHGVAPGRWRTQQRGALPAAAA